jgi:GWxTD domain-containing protein
MNLHRWIDSPAAMALGWALFHSLWQGALAALALAAVLLATPSARIRYAAAGLAMLGMLLGFAIAFSTSISPDRIALPPTTKAAHAAAASGAIRADDDPSELAPRWLPTGILPWLTPFWTAGVLLFHLRSLAHWLAARRLRGTAVCCASAAWQDRFARLAARMRASPQIALLESALAEVPLVMGHLRPVVLVPVGMLAGLPANQVESILLHELAHIRRADYLVNLLQTFVESIFFYHPAAWWISRVIRAERENCCDDLVVAASGDAHAYALALAALERNRWAAGGAALAATGGSLVKRIRRLLQQPEGVRSGLAPVFSAAILTITLALALRGWQSPPPPLSPYLKWLTEDVAYIVDDAERNAFLNLKTDEEKEHFIEQFWQRRNPVPGSGANSFKEEHYRRIAYADNRFTSSAGPGWTTDRARIYIQFGPADELESHPFGDASSYPFEQWLYRHIDGLGDRVIFTFVDRSWTADYRLSANPSDRLVPGGNPVTGSLGRIYAAVQAVDGGALITIPMSAFGAHHVKLAASILLGGRRVAASFEDGLQGPSPAYTKLVHMRPGSYRLKLTVKDVTSGAIGTEDLDFEVQ